MKLCRSLTGKGTQQTLRFFKNINKEFKILKFKSGTKVFDWKIPLEWNIRDGYIQHESKKKFAQFKKCNLHVIGYSQPINKKMNRETLLKNIYTQKNQPNAIPYVTSYNRAARIIEQMEDNGIVSKANHVGKREVL